MIGADAHEAARCQEGYACHGPGCRVTAGKTRRKQNWARPKKNKHEADAITPKSATKKNKEKVSR